MPIPQALVARYFQLIVSRQFTEAETRAGKSKTENAENRLEQRILPSFIRNVPFTQKQQ